VKELCRFCSAAAQILHERTQDGGHQRGPHAMPHHVANKHARQGVRDLKDIKKITAHP